MLLTYADTMKHYDELITQGYKALRKAARTGQGIDYGMLAAPLGRIEQGVRELRAELEHGPHGDIKPGIQRRARPQTPNS